MSRRALTIAETASRLRVKRQRVSQLLAEQRLEGPDYGQGRAPANAPRVWASSLAKYERELRKPRAESKSRMSELERRVSELEARLEPYYPLASVQLHDVPSGGVKDTSGRGPRDSRADAQVNAIQAALARERAARQAAIELKVTIDDLLTKYQGQLDKNVALKLQVAELEAQLEAAKDGADIIASANRGLGDSITQLLGPDSLDDT